MQGMGWLTTEELWWDEEGRLRTHAPSTYKIPGSRDAPAIFNVKMLDNAPNARGDDLPLQGGRRAAADAGDRGLDRAQGRHRRRPAISRTAVRLDAPATPERILAAIATLKR